MKMVIHNVSFNTSSIVEKNFINSYKILNNTSIITFGPNIKGSEYYLLIATTLGSYKRVKKIKINDRVSSTDYYCCEINVRNPKSKLKIAGIIIPSSELSIKKENTMEIFFRKNDTISKELSIVYKLSNSTSNYTHLKKNDDQISSGYKPESEYAIQIKSAEIDSTISVVDQTIPSLYNNTSNVMSLAKLLTNSDDKFYNIFNNYHQEENIENSIFAPISEEKNPVVEVNDKALVNNDRDYLEGLREKVESIGRSTITHSQKEYLLEIIRILKKDYLFLDSYSILSVLEYLI